MIYKYIIQVEFRTHYKKRGVSEKPESKEEYK